MKISIFASIWSQNLWDELILKNEIKLLEEKYWKNTCFIVFTYDRKNPFFTQKNIKYKEYFPIWIRDKKNLFRNIKNFINFIFETWTSDLIVLWWGGIIYDIEYQNTNIPLELWLKRIKVFNFFNKKYIFFRWGINIKNIENLDLVKKIFIKAHKIEVRDEYSYDLLRNLWIKSKIELDPVFYDRGVLIKNNSLVWIVSSYNFNKYYLNNFDFKWKTIWLALRSWYFVQESKISWRMEEWIIAEVIEALVKNGAKVILLPHSFHKTDNKANDYIFLKKFSSKQVILKNNMEDVYEIYKNKEVDFIFAMRLHSIILSHVYEIPFVAISYSTKTDEVLKNFN